ncbi:DUF937 domain-containing protein, partial [Moraxella sp.]|uniref:DUF937 domain-containing protein n=1 Tax=Moraxella sp. TaxID=479 RepID=UPI00262CBFCF
LFIFLNFKLEYMADLMDLLNGQLSDGMLDMLSQQMGGADKEQTAAAASGIMSTLMGALAKNASTEDGAQSLNNALENDHDGSILDDVMGMLSGQNAKPEHSKMLNGGGILKHLLGDRQGGAIDMISKMSGLSSGNTGNLMSMLAPLVMGTLGQQKRQSGLDVGGLMSLLSGTVGGRKDKDPMMGLVSSFLDKDGDGSIVDDVAGMGMKILGGLFKRR